MLNNDKISSGVFLFFPLKNKAHYQNYGKICIEQIKFN